MFTYTATTSKNLAPAGLIPSQLTSRSTWKGISEFGITANASDSERVNSSVIIMGQSDMRDIEQWLQKVSLEQLILEYGTFLKSFSF